MRRFGVRPTRDEYRIEIPHVGVFIGKRAEERRIARTFEVYGEVEGLARCLDAGKLRKVG